MKQRIMISIFFSILVISMGAGVGNQEQGKENKSGMQMQAEAVVSPMISYQGTLHDSSGSPVNGVKYITFRLYNVLTGGNYLWEESKSIEVKKGLFNTKLGELNPLNANQFTEALWLEIVVEGETLWPRQQLLGSPYAFSLVPGAKITANNVEDAFTVTNSGYSPVTGIIGRAEVFDPIGTGTAFGVYGVAKRSYCGTFCSAPIYGGYFEADPANSLGGTSGGVYGKGDVGVIVQTARVSRALLVVSIHGKQGFMAVARIWPLVYMEKVTKDSGAFLKARTTIMTWRLVAM